MRILIIDRNPESAPSVAAMLAGHDVAIETDSLSALARIVTADRTRLRFDVVLCDAAMTGLSSVELRAGLHAHRDPPVFVQLYAEGPIDRSADGALHEPFDRAQLVELVCGLVDQRRTARTQRIQCLRQAS